MNRITLADIKAADKGEMSVALMGKVGIFAKDPNNSVAERAEALRIACQYMPRKQGDMTDEQFVNSFVTGQAY